MGSPSQSPNSAPSPFILLDDQVVSATVSFVDDEGNPATPPAGAVPAWALVDPDGTLGITPSADGLSCVIKASVKLTVTQAAQVNVSAGALSGSVQIQVNASAAAALAIGLGTPAHQ